MGRIEINSEYENSIGANKNCDIPIMIRPRPSDVNNDVLYIKCKVDSSILAYIFIHFRYTTS